MFPVPCARLHDEMAPKEIDSTEVPIAKEIFRLSSAFPRVTAAAVMALLAGRAGSGDIGCRSRMSPDTLGGCAAKPAEAN